MKKSEYKSINSSSTKKISKDKGQKSGGCKCGCQAMTKSNCPDPFTTKTNDDKKPLIKSKDKNKQY
mgnify:FL=1|tara:strand:+ start:949 stop:1146 length:198 start_codon:yes stop_codon:yes gene_type:complete